MIKKLVIGTASVVVLSSLVFGRDVFSYVKTFGCSARNAIKAEVPIEFEIQRARDLVENLVPEIRKCMHVIAEEEVSVEHLQRDIAAAHAGLSRQKEEILALRRDLGRGQQTYQYASRVYTAGDVRRDLATRFERYKVADETLATKQQMLTAREKSVAAARSQLENYLGTKRDLEVQIENLEARFKIVQAAQSASHVQVDNSQLARAKKLISDLNKQLDVAQRVLDAEGKFTGLIPVDAVSQVPEDLANQIDEYFGKERPTEEDNSVAGRG
ncbi:MAG: hypothetical protein ACT4QC_16020 [Planctomycetaceae bacterium]